MLGVAAALAVTLGATTAAKADGHAVVIGDIVGDQASTGDIVSYGLGPKLSLIHI